MLQTYKTFDRDKSKNREEESNPNMENLRLSDEESKGENNVNRLNFGKREV